MSNKIYPIGIQNFESLRQDGYFYIDKTALIYQLVKTGRYYFLSRPRRFGKSLLLSTIEAYFQGKKELFTGLAMEKLEKDWTEYPILHLDLNARNYENKDSLKEELNKHLEIWEHSYNSPYADRAPEERFYHVVRLAYEQTGQRVVILVDEYDKPMLQTIGNEALQQEYRNMLKPLYGVLKTLDGCIKFAMLTGVTKFGKVSVFSDLNNLDDLSMQNKYIDICGISDKELHDNLEKEMHKFAEANEITYQQFCAKLREYYNGYHFAPNSIGIYNPSSLLYAFRYKKFSNYWFEIGTPSFLVNLLKLNCCDWESLANTRIDIDVLNNINDEVDLIPAFFLSGYLTIKRYDDEFGICHLGFPNREVKQSFVNSLIPLITKITKSA